MPTVEIRMPDEANEGTEAAVAAWLFAVNDAVAANQPLVEISTDKVTLEIASPATGILRSITQLAGASVQPGDLLGIIETGELTQPASTPKQEIAAPGAPEKFLVKADAATPVAQFPNTYSPVVRRLLLELGLDPAQIRKVDRGTRLTPQDIRAYVAEQGTEASVKTTGRLVPHTPMRRSIARHMTQSVASAPHVTSVFEADLSAVLADRNRRKQSGEDAAPSVTAYLIHAAVQAMQAAPEANSKWHDAHLELFDHVHFGVGTALPSGGLVVPVIRDAQRLTLIEISHQLRELTDRARAGKLTAADLEGGTFTLSNHGVSGSLLAAPIILAHGQAAILGAGKMQKRVVVCETGGRELFRVRPMMYVTLTVDHRVLDAQQTNAFLTAFVAALEAPLAD